jgi:hypothetical protein
MHTVHSEFILDQVGSAFLLCERICQDDTVLNRYGTHVAERWRLTCGRWVQPRDRPLPRRMVDDFTEPQEGRAMQTQDVPLWLGGEDVCRLHAARAGGRPDSHTAARRPLLNVRSRPNTARDGGCTEVRPRGRSVVQP